MICNEKLTQALQLATHKDTHKNIHFDDADKYFCKELSLLYKNFIDCSHTPEDNDILLNDMLNLTKTWMKMKSGQPTFSMENITANRFTKMIMAEMDNATLSISDIPDLVQSWSSAGCALLDNDESN